MQRIVPGTLAFCHNMAVKVDGSNQFCRLDHYFPIKLKTEGVFRYIGSAGGERNANFIGLWFLVPDQAGIIASAWGTLVCGGGTISPSQDVVLIPDKFGMISVPYDEDGFAFWHRKAGI